jgi:hypothetical protein
MEVDKFTDSMNTVDFRQSLNLSGILPRLMYSHPWREIKLPLEIAFYENTNILYRIIYDYRY